jgi:GNAT superfamily N-acetyltransferase
MGEATIRRATAADVPAIVGLLADDVLGAQREEPGDPAYAQAFEATAADPHQWLMVADADGEVVGTLQLTVIPGLSHRGMTRAQVEAVRVAGSQRGSGLGTRLLEWAVGQSRELGCGVVQLTSNASRADAHRFYDRLGFEASHTGFKLALHPPR